MNNPIASKTLLATSLLLAAFATGCNSSEEDPQPEGDSASKASALTSDVREARRSPSGNLDAGSLPDLMGRYDDLETVTLGADLPGGLDLDFTASLGGCLQGSETSGEIDLACADTGSTGILRYDLGTDGGNSWVYFEMENVCTDDVCVTGEGAVTVSASGAGSEQVVAGDFTIDRGGDRHELRYGISLSAGDGGFESSVVLWQDGDSYVVTTSVGGLGVSVQVEGANGTWSCDLSGLDQTTTGSCSNGGETFEI
ncbi:MAG: hypothetical protein KC731_18260 [Myxococcales bacterium]|nr:hypothetical protein [Myxococcales bacterium]